MSDHEYHARLSPSGASRWLACPGSVVLTADIPNRDSSYSAEGTCAHTIATWCLTDKMPAAEYVGEVVNVGEFKIPVTKDMARYVQMYVDYVLECAEGKMLFVEVAVPIGHLTGEEGATGKADAIIVDTKTRNIRVIDLKYGAGVPVYADGNEQMQMYALGAIEHCDPISDFDTATLVIFQPRVRDLPDEWEISTRQLETFAEIVAAGADTVRAATVRRDAASDAWVEAYLKPGEKQCKFCDAMATCPAARNEVMLHAGTGAPATIEDFAAMGADEIKEDTSGNWLSVAMSKVGLVEMWCKAVRAEVERRLLGNQPIDGWKLVQGREGPRKWTDPDEAEKLLRSFRYTVEEIYDRKVISPTSAERLMKPQPKRWEKVQPLIGRSTGALSVAPESDKRPAAQVTASAADFAALAAPRDD